MSKKVYFTKPSKKRLSSNLNAKLYPVFYSEAVSFITSFFIFFCVHEENKLCSTCPFDFSVLHRTYKLSLEKECVFSAKPFHLIYFPYGILLYTYEYT